MMIIAGVLFVITTYLLVALPILLNYTFDCVQKAVYICMGIMGYGGATLYFFTAKRIKR